MYNTVVRRIVRSILKEMNLVCLSGYYITTTREIGINEGNIAAELFNLRLSLCAALFYGYQFI